MKLINILNLSKTYHTKTKEILTIDNLNLDIDEHKIISIVGPSGCGKSTLLNLLTNLDKPSKGTIKTNKDLNIGYMMQTDALLPWLTVYENANLSLKLKKLKDDEYIDYLLKKYKLDEFKNEYPSNLSGGMKQRLALARTLAIKPNILLLDEPFSKLDINTKTEIIDDIYKIIKELNITAILITHDIKEALSLSDEIILLTKRPSKIKKIYKLEYDSNLLPHERDINDLYKEIWNNIDHV